MRSKGTGSDDPGRAGSGSGGRGGRFGRRSPERTTPGTGADPWADDQWDDGWSERTPAGRAATGPGPQQVDAWLESDPDGGEITRDIAQRWTGSEVPPPGGTWTDDPVDTWDADDEPADAPAPGGVATPSFESLDDDEPGLTSDDRLGHAPTHGLQPAVATSLFAAPVEEPAEPADAPIRRGAAAQRTTGPVFDPHPFVEADTFAAEPPPARRRAEVADDGVERPGSTVTAEHTGGRISGAVHQTAAAFSDSALRTARILGTVCVAIVAIRVLLSLAAAAGTIEGGVFLDRIATLSGMHGTAYAVALLLGVWLLSLSRSDDGAEAPAAALGVALTSAAIMLVGAVLSARLDFRALDAINESGGDASLARLAQVGADAVGPVGLSVLTAWAALRATSER